MWVTPICSNSGVVMVNNLSLGLTAGDGAKIIVNFTYGTDFQCQYYVLNSLVLNIKYPSMKPKQPGQRNSFSSLSNLNRPPPGFESFGPKNPTMNVSKFAGASKPLGFEGSRGFSPPLEEKKNMVRRKPTFTKSSQNCIPPLESDEQKPKEPSLLKPKQDLNIDGLLREASSKNKNASDSLSDDNDQYLIKEESNDDEEEKTPTNTSPTIPVTKLNEE